MLCCRETQRLGLHSLKRINPVFLLVFFSILIFVLRKVLFPEYSDDALVGYIEAFLARFGNFSILILMGVYFLCSFFFIPILIPLNIACGAIFGPMLGSVVGLAGILVSCLATTVSVRYVFRGMGAFAMNHQDVKRFLNQITRHGIIVVVLVRLAFVVPYLVQNFVLALTNLRLARLLALTLVGGLPGVVSYSFLGAGLMRLDDAGTYGVLLMVPLVLLVLVSLVIHVLRRQAGIGADDD